MRRCACSNRGGPLRAVALGAGLFEQTVDRVVAKAHVVCAAGEWNMSYGST